MSGQVPTFPNTIGALMRNPKFARGLADARAGKPFADCVVDSYWAYERGRQCGMVAPHGMPPFVGVHLNPRAIKLFEKAVDMILRCLMAAGGTAERSPWSQPIGTFVYK